MSVKKTFIIFAFVIVAVAVASFFVGRLSNKAEEAEDVVTEVKMEMTAEPDVYKSSAFSFSFRHEGLVVTEESSSRIAIRNANEGASNPIAYVDVIIEGADAEVPYEQFVLDETRLLCGESSPGASCSEINDLSLIVNQNGLSAQKFFLVFEENGNKRDKGPFLAFNFSENTPGLVSFVLVRPPLTNLGSVDAIEDIAASIDF
jgi:hypothetical protein